MEFWLICIFDYIYYDVSLLRKKKFDTSIKEFTNLKIIRDVLLWAIFSIKWLECV